MNWQEALEAMEQGYKLAHPAFPATSYFHMLDGRVYDDEGVPLVGWYKGADWVFGGWTIVEDEA